MLGWGSAGKELVSIAAQKGPFSLSLALPCGCLYPGEIPQLCLSPEESKAQQCSEAGTPGVGKAVGMWLGNASHSQGLARAGSDCHHRALE